MSLLHTLYSLDVYHIRPSEKFPGNYLPVLHYTNVLNTESWITPIKTRLLFKKNKWYNFRSGGIFTYHHYHSNTHEVLAILKGSTSLLLGGETGTTVGIKQGDVLLIPAGVAHKNIHDEYDVACLAAYYNGTIPDIQYGHPGERPDTDERIKQLPLPESDPAFGKDGQLQPLWISNRQPDKFKKILEL